jgi:murein L,D-transpeptidase YafK
LIYCLRVGFFLAGFFICILTRLQPVAAELLQASPKIKPDFFVSMDGGVASEYAIVVEKETQKLVLYRFDGVYEPVFNVKCSTGEVPGIKTRSGDKKTPEGVYFFTGLFEKKYLSAVYGEMAFPMDYPNLIDQLNGREGNSIWMHGTNKQIKDRDSNGCIVLANADIEKLSKYITVNRTPIIVTDKIHYTELDDDQAIKEQLMAFLNEWNGALLNGSYERYLSFYDQGTISRIAWWDEWNDMRNELRKSGVSANIHLNKLSIYKHNGLYTALFDQLIQVGKQVQDVGTRKVCLKTEADTIRIIGDIYQSVMPKENEQKTVNPFLRACHDLKKHYSSNDDIEALVDKWLTAWKNKDIETYGDCYASDFRFKEMDRKAWLEKKKRLSRRYKYISVSKEKLVVKTGVKTSTAIFIQNYKSSGYRAVGTKELIFKRENGQWKIYRERWKKI